MQLTSPDDWLSQTASAARNLDSIRADVIREVLAGSRVVVATGAAAIENTVLADMLEAELARHRTRVIRIDSLYGQPIDTRRLLTRVLSLAPGTSHQDRVEQFFATLTRHYADEARIALLIDDAERMAPDTLECIGLLLTASRTSALPLHVLFFGRDEVWGILPKQGVLSPANITSRYQVGAQSGPDGPPPATPSVCEAAPGTGRASATAAKLSPLALIVPAAPQTLQAAPPAFRREPRLDLRPTLAVWQNRPIRTAAVALGVVVVAVGCWFLLQPTGEKGPADFAAASIGDKRIPSLTATAAAQVHTPGDTSPPSPAEILRLQQAPPAPENTAGGGASAPEPASPPASREGAPKEAADLARQRTIANDQPPAADQPEQASADHPSRVPSDPDPAPAVSEPPPVSQSPERVSSEPEPSEKAPAKGSLAEPSAVVPVKPQAAEPATPAASANARPDASTPKPQEAPSPPATPDGSAPSPTASVASQPSAPPAAQAALIARGDSFLALGDVATARLLYERAASLKSGRAAIAAGMTYDPFFLSRASARGIKPDPKAARTWYQRAAALGDPEAQSLLERLGKTGTE